MEAAAFSKLRRGLLGALSLAIAASLLLLFLPRNGGAFRAVPSQTALLLEFDGLLRLKPLFEKSSEPRWKQALQGPIFQRYTEDADAMARLFKHKPELLKGLVKNKTLAALSLNPADSLHALFAIALDENLNLEQVLGANPLTTKYFPHQFHGNRIFNVHLSKTEQLEVAVRGRILLFSRRATLVEDALAQLENARNWWSDRPCIGDLPEAPLRIHLRPAALAEQWRNQMTSRWRTLPDLLARNVVWLGLSWSGEQAQIIAETSGALAQISNWGTTPQNTDLFGILPENTAFAAHAWVGNVPEFFGQIGKTRAGDFERYVLPWVGREAAFALTEPLSPALNADRLLLLAVRDSAMAAHCLRTYGRVQGTLPGTGEPYQMFEMFGFRSATLLEPLLAGDEAFQNPACALLGKFAVFAPDRSSLEVFLDKYLVNQTLAANTDFLQAQQNLPKQGATSFWLNTAYLPAILQNIFSEAPDATLLKGLKNAFFAAELRPSSGRKVRIAPTVQDLAQAPIETDILWKTALPATLATQPYRIGLPDGTTQILVQDQQNRLYCLDAQNGATRWRRDLPERIISEIRGIDFYGNGTRNCSFNTATQIFTLDENGRDVQGFPFQLPARATNGATVVDFDGSFKFCYFVACDNGQTYGFGHLGKPLEGWNARPSGGAVQQPILHFQHKGKDYLAVLTRGGLLSVFGRDGSLRFEPWQLEGEFLGPLVVDADAAKPQIYGANTAGKAYACDLKGELTEQQIGAEGCQIVFGQLADDPSFEWAMLAGNTLSVGAWAGGEAILFKKKFTEKQHRVFIPKSDFVATLDLRGRRIWLLNNEGKTPSGFPLGGNTPFHFAKVNGVEMLVTGNGNSVWAYRMR